MTSMDRNPSDTAASRPGFFAALARRLAWLVRPSAVITDVLQRRRASLLAGLSLLLLASGTLSFIGLVGRRQRDARSFTLDLLVFFVLMMLVVYTLARSRHWRIGSWLMVGALSSLAYLTLFLGYQTPMNPANVLFTYLTLAFVMGMALFSHRQLLILVGLNEVAIWLTYTLNPYLAPAQAPQVMGQVMMIGVLMAVVSATRDGMEKARLNEAQAASQKLTVLQTSLEDRVAERTRALQSSLEVSQHLATLPDRERLAPAVAEVVQRAFGYYHAQIYLLDESKTKLALVGGTGEAGRVLLAQGHQIEVGQGLVGRAAAANRMALALDTRSEPNWLPNVLLPDTRAEVAVPIAIGAEVLGVLDVQDDQVWTADETRLTLLQNIANQAAVALQNARQFVQTQAALREANMFRKSAENAGQGMAVGSLDGKLLYINPAFLQMIGLERPDQILGQRFSPFYPPDVQEKMRFEIMPEVMRSGQWSGELTLLTQDGRLTPVLENVFLLPGETPDQRLVAVIATDMTERKQTQERLARQAQDLARVAEVSTAVSHILDPDTLIQQVVNLVQEKFGLYFVNLFLYNPDSERLEMSYGSGEIGQKMVAAKWSVPIAHESSLLAQAARARQSVVVNDVRRLPNFLTDALLPDTAAELTVPLLVGDELLGVLDVESDQVDYFTASDISIQTTLAAQIAVALQNARRYQQTRQSEQLVRTIIDATPDWIFIKDRAHRYQLVNRGYADSILRTPDQMLGKDDLELGQPEELVKGNPEKGIHGYWVDDDEIIASHERRNIASEQILVQGQRRLFNMVKVPLEDEQGQVWGVLAFGRDITEREMLQKETTQRLEEINALYRAMSREGWQAYMEGAQRQTSFLFDQQTVRPVSEAQAAPEKPMLTVPLALRGSVIGALAVEDDPQKPLTEEELASLEQMAEQVAQALESARLFEQTQSALGLTESLYAGSDGVLRSSDAQDVLRAVVESTTLKRFATSLVLLFDRPWTEQPANTAAIVASYTPASPNPADMPPALKAVMPVGRVLDLHQTQLVENMRRDRVLFMADAQTEQALQPEARASLSVLGRAVAIFPLLAGDQWIGWLITTSTEPISLTDEQMRQVQTLLGQAATVLQGQRLFEQTQARARYEQALREVTARVRASSDPDTVLRTAVREVGALLGRNALIRLGEPQTRPLAPESK